MLAQTEIFGPVLVSSTFRTHDEAVALANNTAYGLAASVWSENINLALDVAPRLKAGWSGSIVRTNSMHLPVSEVIGKAASAGKGHEGMFEYLKPAGNLRGKTSAKICVSVFACSDGKF